MDFGGSDESPVEPKKGKSKTPRKEKENVLKQMDISLDSGGSDESSWNPTDVLALAFLKPEEAAALVFSNPSPTFFPADLPPLLFLVRNQRELHHGKARFLEITISHLFKLLISKDISMDFGGNDESPVEPKKGKSKTPRKEKENVLKQMDISMDSSGSDESPVEPKKGKSKTPRKAKENILKQS
ncbi:hypothetical protein NE237_022446 [Protea cynaroides]|uniref:Uncharacterized protein n=1 Tax=Protea cynaroides TaxID=273540 RepID=A0A9Q0K4H1_9MAGN|nr:hypothetical protein NE237_022446 [Protea cynaroides]